MNGVFLTVFNMSITGALIIAALVILRLCLKNMPRRYSYMLWAIPAIRLLCPVSISSVLSVFNLFKPAVTESRMDYIPDTSFNYYITPNPAPSVQIEPAVVPSTVIEEPVTANMNPNSFGISALDIISLLWIVGAAVILIWCVISYVSVLRRVRGAEKCGEYWLCKNIQSPFVFGIIKPRIYLPEGLSDGDILCILAHEKTHVKRRDYIVKLLTVPILALHWFNPFVWLAQKLMSTDMELSCDELALSTLSADYKKDYANALLNISMRQNGISFGGILGFGESGIKTRIKGVLKMKKPKLWATVAAIAVVVIAAVCLLTNAIGKTSTGGLDDEVGGYVSYLKAGIPDLRYDEAGGYDGALEKAILDQETVCGHTVYLLGEKVYTIAEMSIDSVMIGNLKVATVNDNGELLTYPVSSELEHGGVGQAGYRIQLSRMADFMTVCEMQQDGETYPLIVLRNSGDMERTEFMTVILGTPTIIMGDFSDAGGPSRDLCANLSNDFAVNSAAGTLKDNVTGITYTFDFVNRLPDGYPVSYKAVGTSVESAVNASLQVDKSLLNYFGMSYIQFREYTQNEAEGYHAEYYIADIPDTLASVVFAGVYDPEEEGTVLNDDNTVIRVQGKLGDIVIGVDGRMTVEELAGGLAASRYQMADGAETAYYVAERYVIIKFVSENLSWALEVAVDDSDYVDLNSDTWLYKSENSEDTEYTQTEYGIMFTMTPTKLNVDIVRYLVDGYLKYHRIMNCKPQLMFDDDPDKAVDGWYFPVVGELSTLDEWETFLSGLFTEDDIEHWINENLLTDRRGGLYRSIDGKIYTSPADGPSASYNDIDVTVDGTKIIIERATELYIDEIEHEITTLYLENTENGWRIYDYERCDEYYDLNGNKLPSDEARFWFSSGRTARNEVSVPEGYKAVGYRGENSDGKYVLRFNIPEEWVHRGYTTVDGADGFKRIEFRVLASDNNDFITYPVFEEGTEYPAVITNSEGYDVTIFEEQMSSGLYDYMSHSRTVADGGFHQYYETYEYVVTRNGMTAWMNFVVYDDYDENVTLEILKSIQISPVEQVSTDGLLYDVSYVQLEMEYPPFSSWDLSYREINDLLNMLSTLDFDSYEVSDEVPTGGGVTCTIGTADGGKYVLNFLRPYIQYRGKFYIVGEHSALKLIEQYAERVAMDSGQWYEVYEIEEAISYIMPKVDNILGFDYKVEKTRTSPNFYFWRLYSVSEGNESQCIAEWFGTPNNSGAYVVDFDGDGINELVCNCVYGADGGQEVRVFRNRNGTIEMGTFREGFHDELGFENHGFGSYGEYYSFNMGFVVTNYLDDGNEIITFNDLSYFDFAPFVPTDIT